MKLKLTPKFVLAFLALTFVMHELHERVCATVGRLICGCWGERGFNFWRLCTDCFSEKPVLFSIFVGHIFTFIIIWMGVFMLGNNKSNRQKSLGFALVFANMPFATIFTAVFGGDIMFALTSIVNNIELARALGLIVVLGFLIFPLYKVFMIIENKWRIGWFLLFLIAPILINLLVELGCLNMLLKKGILSSPQLLGSPIIVTIWTISITTLCILTWKNIYTLAEEKTLNSDNT